MSRFYSKMARALGVIEAKSGKPKHYSWSVSDQRTRIFFRRAPDAHSK